MVSPVSISDSTPPSHFLAAFRFFRSEIHNRYIRMHANGNMDVSDTKGKHELPSGWTWERFTPVDAGNGEWALWSRKSTCARRTVRSSLVSATHSLRQCRCFMDWRLLGCTGRSCVYVKTSQAAVRADY